MGDYFIDILIAIPLVWGLYRGFSKGVVYEAAVLVALVLGIYGGFHLAVYAQEYLDNYFEINSILLPYVSFAAVFALIVMLVILLSKFLEGMIRITGLSFINKILGALFGIVKWSILTGIFVSFLIPINNKFNLVPPEKTENSYLYKPIIKLSEWLTPELKWLKGNSVPDTPEKTHEKTND